MNVTGRNDVCVKGLLINVSFAPVLTMMHWKFVVNHIASTYGQKYLSNNSTSFTLSTCVHLLGRKVHIHNGNFACNLHFKVILP